MIIIGGTYSEICFEPIWENIFGSGFRAVNMVLQVNPKQKIDYYTCADKELSDYLNYHKNLNASLNLHISDIFKSPEFHYDHPLRTPIIHPRPDLYKHLDVTIHAKGDNVLVYGLIEATFNVEGDKVVYDPQSPANPKTFTSTGSKANQLITIVNFGEAKLITKSDNVSEIKDFFFNHESCHALIIKMGAQGALLFESIDDEPFKIPVFKTDKVWPIGSGDVFSAYFAHSWFNGETIQQSALSASVATAKYCNTRDFSNLGSSDLTQLESLIINSVPTGQVYLAGPFFTFSERWLVHEAWNALKGMGLKVFSPFHDVGHGKATDVVHKDLIGLDESDIIFGILDGLDSGTLFEIGYAISKGKKVVAFVQNENEESLKMLEGTGCILEQDFATAIYKTYWSFGKA